MHNHTQTRSQLPRRLTSVLGLLLVLFLAHMQGMAQSVHGTIVGSVTDPSAAAISGAHVTLTNINEGTVRTTTTDSQGGYSFADVKPSRYTVEITGATFQKWTQMNFVLEARQALRVDAKLALGNVSETIQVSGENASAIETETPSISSSFSSEEVLNLPTNFRASSGGSSAIGLFGALPNVQMADTQHFSVQGGLAWQAEATIDGIPITATDANTPRGDQFPAADMIAEVRADGLLNNAELGQPGQMSIITRGGTNKIRGAAYWYHQNEDFDALQFGAATKPHKVSNTFGVNLAGPVVIPHVINGHDRLFFYVGYEGYRYPSTSAYQFTVPTAEMKNGDFSGYSSSIFNPANGDTLRNPYDGTSWGTQIPSSYFSGVAKQFLQFYPDPNHTATANGQTIDTHHFVYGQTANYYVNKDTSAHSDQIDIRPDWYVGSNQKLLIWGRYTHKSYPSIYPWPLAVPGAATIAPNDSLVASANWTAKPNLINEFRFGIFRLVYAHQQSFDGIGFMKQLGFTGYNFNPWYNGISTLSFGTYSRQSQDSGRMNLSFFVRQFIYNDNLMWTHGSHNFKFGVEYRQALDSSPPNGNNYPYFYFQDTSNGHGMFSGVDWGDFMIGLPFHTNVETMPAANIGRNLMQNYYAQDQWRVTPRLTISYGIRYEYHPPFVEDNGQIGTFDPTVPLSGRALYPKGGTAILAHGTLRNLNACDPDGVNNTNNATVNGAPCMPVLTNEQAGLGAGLRPTPNMRFMPRFGVAYRLTDDSRWVVRAGVGLYNITTLGIIFNQMLGRLQGNNDDYYNTYDTTSHAIGFQWPSVAGGPAAVSGVSYGTNGTGGVNVVNWHDPYTEQWTVSLDHDFGHGYAARASYVGSATRHLGWHAQWNVLPFSSSAEAYTQPFTARPFPNAGPVNMVESSAMSNYNALEIEVSHRFQRGLEFNSTFTWAKALADNSNGGSGFQNEDGAGWIISDRHAGFGNASGILPKTWKTTALWDIPVGRGRRVGANMPYALDAIIGGWRLTNVFNWNSGTYLTPSLGGGSGDPSGTGLSISRGASGASFPGSGIIPDVVRGVSWKAQHQSRKGWLNSAAFTCPGDSNWKPGFSCRTGDASGNTATLNGVSYPGYENIGGTLYPIPGPIGRLGNMEMGSVRGPQFVQLDSGLVKTFLLGERFKLRAEGTFTNVLNHVNLGNPNAGLDSASFGVITGASGSARVGQVSMRLDF